MQSTFADRRKVVVRLQAISIDKKENLSSFGTGQIINRKRNEIRERKNINKPRLTDGLVVGSLAMLVDVETLFLDSLLNA